MRLHTHSSEACVIGMAAVDMPEVSEDFAFLCWGISTDWYKCSISSDIFKFDLLAEKRIYLQKSGHMAVLCKPSIQPTICPSHLRDQEGGTVFAVV